MKVLAAYGPLAASSITSIRTAGPSIELTYEPGRNMAAATALLADDTEVAFMNGLPLSIPPSRRLRWVQIASAGVDTYKASPAWADPGILVTTASGIASNSIAEYALAMMLIRGHRLERAMAVKAARAWPEGEEGYVPLAAQMLHGRTLGLIGFGGVGRRLAWFGRALGMQVLAVRASVRPPRPSYRPTDLEFADEGTAGVTVRGPEGLTELIEASDYVVIAVPRTPSTIGMIGRRELARMKPTSHLVNTARGGIVDEDALAEALRGGRPAFASIDVTAVEPLAGDSPLYDLPNCQITPHIAGYFVGYEDAAAQVFAANLRRYVRGQPLLNLVDRAAGY